MGVRLKEKVAIITGGAGGIGRAAGRLFVAEGAQVLLADIDEDALRNAVAEIGSNQVSHCVTDVTDLEANQAMVALAEELDAKVDSLEKAVKRKHRVFTRVDGDNGVARIALLERRTS